MSLPFPKPSMNTVFYLHSGHRGNISCLGSGSLNCLVQTPPSQRGPVIISSVVFCYHEKGEVLLQYLYVWHGTLHLLSVSTQPSRADEHVKY